jgi:hypothetical protein
VTALPAQGVPYALWCRCGRKRGYLPHPAGPNGVLLSSVVVVGGQAGVLLCGQCDYDHDHATVIPREHAVRDVKVPDA